MTIKVPTGGHVEIFSVEEVNALLRPRDAALAELSARVARLEASPPGSAPEPPPSGAAPATITMLEAVTSPVERSSPAIGNYFVAVNPWGTFKATQPWSIRVGGGLRNDGSLDFLIEWDFRKEAQVGDILAYPEAVYGLGGGYNGSWPNWDGRKAGTRPLLPARLGDIKCLASSSTGVVSTGIKGLAQLVYDLWICHGGRPASQLMNVQEKERKVEIMIPMVSYGGYGVPEVGSGSAREGRTGLGAGRMGPPKERATVSGILVDAYWFPAGTFLKWTFVVLLPVTFPAHGAHRLDWKAVLDYVVSKGLATQDDILAGIEYGIEPSTGNNIYDKGLSLDEAGYNGTAGSVLVDAFKVEGVVA